MWKYRSSDFLLANEETYSKYTDVWTKKRNIRWVQILRIFVNEQDVTGTNGRSLPHQYPEIDEQVEIAQSRKSFDRRGPSKMFLHIHFSIRCLDFPIPSKNTIGTYRQKILSGNETNASLPFYIRHKSLHVYKGSSCQGICEETYSEVTVENEYVGSMSITFQRRYFLLGWVF